MPIKNYSMMNRLRKTSPYGEVVNGLNTFFQGEKSFGAAADGSKHSLIDALRAPALASPYSLTGQLEF